MTQPTDEEIRELWEQFSPMYAKDFARAVLAKWGEPQQAAPATDSYVQPVPDKCDRIVWRGSYYHLPLIDHHQVAPATKKESNENTTK